MVGAGTKNKVLSLVWVPRRCLGQGGPDCPCLCGQPGHHRQLPGAGESLGRGPLAGCSLASCTLVAKRELLWFSPYPSALTRHCSPRSGRLTNWLWAPGSVLEKYGQPSLRKPQERPSGVILSTQRGSSRVKKGAKLCPLKPLSPKAFLCTPAFGAGGKGGITLCTLNAFDPLGASVPLLGKKWDRRPSEGVFNLGETSKILEVFVELRCLEDSVCWGEVFFESLRVHS